MDALDYSSFLLASSPPRFDASIFSRLNFNSIESRREVESFEQPFPEKDGDHGEPEFPDGNGDVEEFASPSISSPGSDLTEQRNERIKAWQSNYEGETIDRCERRVIFADESGMRLAEEIDDDDDDDDDDFSTSGVNSNLSNCEYLQIRCSNFSLPTSPDVFKERLLTQGVCLEKVSISCDTIRGVVWASSHNGSEFKGGVVFVRCTLDGWQSFDDHEAAYIGRGSLALIARKNFDIYEFELVLDPGSWKSGFIFAIKLRTNGVDEFWDNNDGKNYVLKVDASD